METVESAFLDPRRTLPTGRVTFLFTDIEGSTVRWERDPVAMQDALRLHDRIMREAIVTAGGSVFKTVGDAFYAVFQEPEAAVDSALAAQRLLGEADFDHVDGLRVRMALHTGTADERDGDYFGQALNRVARLLAIGHGGQIVLSSAIAELAASKLSDETTLRDLGEHRLKDLTAPEQVFQLLAPGLERNFPKLKSLSVLDNNLPQQLTSLIGRDADVSAIKELSSASSLVTLIGAGGIGKTRVALQVGAEQLDSFADGVWFADFAPLTDPALLANTIGAVFELQESGSRSMLDSLVAYLKPKKMLLILDNCEHMIAETSAVAAGILRACDGVKILATSREHLSVTGEALYRMPSLAVPEPGNGLTAEAALQFGAVALFVARAIAANARFAFSDDRAPIVAEICRRLDGIPLAIELAAARSRVLAPKQLLEKLNERFRLLTGGDRTALPRQQTMRAAIDWSYDLLGPDERSVFRTLSIFAGSFALETVAAVYAGNELDEFDVFAIVASLADKSLIHADPSDDGLVRYRLLESTRQYGAEALIESGERDDVATKHAEAYALVAEAIVDDYDTSVHGMWLARVEAELENIRAALGWASNPMVEPSVILRLATSLHRTMALFNAREAQRWVASALERCDEATDPGVVGRLELAQAFLSNVSNQFSAVHLHATNALAHFDDVENARQKADAQRLAGRSLVYLGQAAEGETFLETALASHRRLGSRGTGAALRDLGLARAAAGDLERARQLLAESLRDFEHREDLTNVAQTVGTLAGIEFQAGNIGVALDHAGFALEVLRKLKRRLSIAWILGEMATFSIELEAFDEARVRAGESLAMAREIPSAFFIAHALRQLATVAVLGSSAGAATRAAQLERAAHVLGFVAGRLAELGTTLEPAEAKQNDRARSRLGDELGPDALVRSEIEGSHFTEDRAIATALALFA